MRNRADAAFLPEMRRIDTAGDGFELPAFDGSISLTFKQARCCEFERRRCLILQRCRIFAEYRCRRFVGFLRRLLHELPGFQLALEILMKFFLRSSPEQELRKFATLFL